MVLIEQLEGLTATEEADVVTLTQHVAAEVEATEAGVAPILPLAPQEEVNAWLTANGFDIVKNDPYEDDDTPFYTAKYIRSGAIVGLGSTEERHVTSSILVQYFEPGAYPDSFLDAEGREWRDEFEAQIRDLELGLDSPLVINIPDEASIVEARAEEASDPGEAVSYNADAEPTLAETDQEEEGLVEFLVRIGWAAEDIEALKDEMDEFMGIPNAIDNYAIRHGNDDTLAALTQADEPLPIPPPVEIPIPEDWTDEPMQQAEMQFTNQVVDVPNFGPVQVIGQVQGEPDETEEQIIKIIMSMFGIDGADDMRQMEEAMEQRKLQAACDTASFHFVTAPVEKLTDNPITHLHLNVVVGNRVKRAVHQTARWMFYHHLMPRRLALKMMTSLEKPRCIHCGELGLKHDNINCFFAL